MKNLKTGQNKPETETIWDRDFRAIMAGFSSNPELVCLEYGAILESAAKYADQMEAERQKRKEKPE